LIPLEPFVSRSMVRVAVMVLVFALGLLVCCFVRRLIR
jgi:hypothetical protein